MTWLTLLAGLVLLVIGAEGLVRGAAAIALRAGISALVIGLTVVSMGTSAPELVVSVTATLEGSSDLAVANVVGSNIFNVLLILGLCALVRPLIVHIALIRREVPVMIGASLALWFMGLDGRIRVLEATVLLAAMIAYVVLSIRAGRREVAAAGDIDRPSEVVPVALPLAALLLVGGLGLLVLGARLLVSAAITIARDLGVDDTIIGLTIVAAGTSLPEVATSVVATLRGQRDIAIGNVVGSNLFNILGILGVSGLVAGGDLSVARSIENFDLPVMVAVALACMPFMTGGRMMRFEGAVFVAFYLAYTAYLVLAAQQHAALPTMSAVMAEFVLPLTAVALVLVLIRRRSAPG
jgi:cation:H+ antiporter